MSVCAALTRRHCIQFTIELRFGQNASTDRKTILSVADIESRDGRVVGHLAEERQRDINAAQREKEREQQKRVVAFLRSVLCLLN